MTIKFTHNPKRINSTKRPTNGVGEYFDITCTLKETCDIKNPVFTVENNSNTRNKFYNQVQWTLGANTYYYFISKRTIINNSHIEIECVEDTLATRKTEIGNTQAYITRCSSESSPYITDTAVMTGNNASTAYDIDNPLTPTGGFYCIGIITAVDATHGTGYSFQRGSVTYYTATQSEMQSLMTHLMTHNTGRLADIDAVSRIVSCVYIPVTRTGTSVATSLFYTEFEDSTTYSLVWNHTQISIGTFGLITHSIGSFNLPNHPSYSSNHRYLNYTPYSEYVLYAGMFGEIRLDRKVMSTTNNEVTGNIFIDCATGEGALTLSTDFGTPGQTYDIRPVYETCAQVGVDILLAQITSRRASDLMQQGHSLFQGTVATGATTLGAGMAAGAAIGSIAGPFGTMVGAGVAALAAGISKGISVARGDAIQAYANSVPHVSMMSSNASMVTIYKDWYLMATFIPVNLDANLLNGYPLCAVRTINTLSGYVQCSGAHASFDCLTLDEILEVDTYLNSGFYYE